MTPPAAPAPENEEMIRLVISIMRDVEKLHELALASGRGQLWNGSAKIKIWVREFWRAI